MLYCFIFFCLVGGCPDSNSLTLLIVPTGQNLREGKWEERGEEGALGNEKLALTKLNYSASLLSFVGLIESC